MRKTAAEYIVVFIIGGLCYGIMEVLSRGFSHITMGILGGASLAVIHTLNEERRNGMNIWLIMFISAVFITSVEFLAGEYLNGVLKMNIWSYKELPLNIDGQICLPFFAVWFALSFVGIVTDDFIRHRIFGEEKAEPMSNGQLTMKFIQN